MHTKDFCQNLQRRVHVLSSGKKILLFDYVQKEIEKICTKEEIKLSQTDQWGDLKVSIAPQRLNRSQGYGAFDRSIFWVYQSLRRISEYRRLSAHNLYRTSYLLPGLKRLQETTLILLETLEKIT